MLSQWKRHLPSVVLILLITTYTSGAFASKKYNSKWNTLDVIILIQQSRNLLCRDSVRVHMMSQNRSWGFQRCAEPDGCRYFRRYIVWCLSTTGLHRYSCKNFEAILQTQCNMLSYSPVKNELLYMCMNKTGVLCKWIICLNDFNY